MFCNTVTFVLDPKTNQYVRVVMTTLVYMENLTEGGTPIIRYLSYIEKNVVIDHTVPLTNLGCEFKLFSSICMYLGVATASVRNY